MDVWRVGSRGNASGCGHTRSTVHRLQMGPRCGRVAPESSPQPEDTMSVAQSVTHILRERVTLTVESIDRMYLNVYVPKLQRVLGVVGFFREQRGATFASSALMEPITTAFVKALERFAQTEGVPLL